KTGWLTKSIAYRHKAVMSLEAHVDILCSVPKLIESRIEIQIHAVWNASDEIFLLQHSRNVQKNSCGSRDGAQFGIGQSERLRCSRQDETASALKIKISGDIQEVRGVLRRLKR